MSKTQLDARAQWLGRLASAASAAGNIPAAILRDARFDLACAYLARAHGIAFWLGR